MHSKITVEFDHEDEAVVHSVHVVLNNMLPYMVDNIKITNETDEQSDVDSLVESYVRAVRLADSGSLTAKREVAHIIRAVSDLGFTKTWLDLQASKVAEGKEN